MQKPRKASEMQKSMITKPENAKLTKAKAKKCIKKCKSQELQSREMQKLRNA